MSGGIVVFAYSEVGYACLDVLLSGGHDVRALFTHEDGPGEEIWFRSCAALARRHGVPVHTVEATGPGDEVEQTIRAIAPDLILSAYYRRMIPMRILSLARLGAFNMHGSLLPKYRGRAPLNWAILNGETEVGVTLHVMTGSADAGDIVGQQVIGVGAAETAGEVAPRLAEAAAGLLASLISGLEAGTAPRFPQNEADATKFGGRTPEDGRIDWHKSASQIFNLVRAVSVPFPGAFTNVDGHKLVLWKVVPVAGESSAAGRSQPGEVLSTQPPVIAAGEGAVEVLAATLDDAAPADTIADDVRALLVAGKILGEIAHE